MKTSEAASKIQTLISELLGLQLELWLDNPAVIGGKLGYAIAVMDITARDLEANLSNLEAVECEYIGGDLGEHGLRIPYRREL